ncbi:hypothetical protein LXL04_007773 [Taraxacum kok-saghyz]
MPLDVSPGRIGRSLMKIGSGYIVKNRRNVNMKPQSKKIETRLEFFQKLHLISKSSKTMAIIATSSRSHIIRPKTHDPCSGAISIAERRRTKWLPKRNLVQLLHDPKLKPVQCRKHVSGNRSSFNSRFIAAILPLGAPISIFSEKAKPIAKRDGSRRNASFPAPIALIPGIRFIYATFYLQYSYIMIQFHNQFHIQFQTSSHSMMQ